MKKVHTTLFKNDNFIYVYKHCKTIIYAFQRVFVFLRRKTEAFRINIQKL